jgi:hypothetical protein
MLFLEEERRAAKLDSFGRIASAKGSFIAGYLPKK